MIYPLIKLTTKEAPRGTFGHGLSDQETHDGRDVHRPEGTGQAKKQRLPIIRNSDHQFTPPLPLFCSQESLPQTTIYLVKSTEKSFELFSFTRDDF